LKTVLKVFGGLLLFVAVAVAGFASFISIRGIPHFEPKPPDLKVEVTPERVARGRKWAVLLCADCHFDPKTGQLTGHDIQANEFGKIFSLNITQHPEKGIGKYTDGDLIYLLRTGVAKDGRYTPPWMAKLPHMADEDLHSIVAFLRSEDPLVKANPAEDYPSEPNMLAKVLANVAFAPLPYPQKPIVAPAASNQVEHGRYLVFNLDCWTCHSKDFKKLNSMEPEKTPDFLIGGNQVANAEQQLVFTRNLTPDPETGIGKWSEDEFVRALRHGVKPDHTAIRFPMQAYTLLTVEEAKAIYAYLKTVPAVRHQVPPTPAYANAPATADAGKKHYFRYGCSSCHGEAGVGACDMTRNKATFPTDEALTSYIRRPFEKHPDTRMPAWEGVIPDEDMAALVKHVRSLDPSLAAAPPAAPATPEAPAAPMGGQP
jgi:mono/diheme cytochrome c family protein